MFRIGDIITLKKDTLIWKKGTTAKVVELECNFDAKCDIVVKVLEAKGLAENIIGKEVGAMSNMFELQERKGGILV